jgi:Protein of unknown function (DUF1579)
VTDDRSPEPQAPRPDPALRRLDFLVGTWSAQGRLLGSDEDNITGEVTIDWLPGGFFLRQHAKLNFAGLYHVDALELIGYDPETDRFPSYAYSNLSPEPLPYEWDVREGSMNIRVSHGPLDATFEGRVSEEGNSYSGGWRPNTGADETFNPPYDLTGTKIG